MRAALIGIALAAALALPLQVRAGPLRDALQDLDEESGPEEQAALPAGVRVERDLAYGADPAQRLDVYRPEHAQNAPVLLMVHGGGWRRGDKAMARVVQNKAAHWVPRGYVLVSSNYRMLPAADPLTQADDVARALAFVQAKAKGWGGDPARVVLMGHSAGAHLASLLAADPAIASAQGAKPWLGTVSLDSGAYDVAEVMSARHLPLFDKAFGSDPAYWKRASPSQRLTQAPAPMLLVCSSRRVVSCPQAQGFAARVSALGGRVTVLPEELSHRQINEDLGIEGPYTVAVEAFLASLGLK